MGADRISLLRLYIMLIKPKLDYGAEAYSSAASAISQRLPPIHNETIRIATGAFRSSPLLRLYAESGIEPLSVYRDVKRINTSLRILANPTYLLHEEALKLSDQGNCGEASRKKGVLCKVQNLNDLNIPVEEVQMEVQSSTLPWKIDNITYCDELFGNSKDSMVPRAFRRLYEEHKESHRFSVTIYTNGSKTGEGGTFAHKNQQEDA